MKKIIFFVLFAFSGFTFSVSAQCEIKNRVLADGTMVYFFDPAVFYTTKSKSLKINIVTDKEQYFIALRPMPFPDKKEGKKINDDLVISLSNHKNYKLTHYDTQYRNGDSTMQVLYLIDDQDITDFAAYEAVSAKINMEGTEFVRTYTFKLQKAAIMKQLQCFFKREE
ncbi:hypothetical protein [Flavobacterium foetidum]|uniref:hypothetical protein n=1 Tax=Flavobacterium foetidum TaxID=2026681 RepID=UPI00107573F9|nr:hypothetical protein [Flavobacterium foetidum]KAF2513473.1 hypothetical protein E0W73_14585 [Flavobacterium foetidum]